MKRKDKDRMRVELLVRMRGPKDFWGAGTIFDTNDGPLPKDILAEIKSGRKTVKILPPEESKGKKLEDDDSEGNGDDEGRSDRSDDQGNQGAVQ
jgi:hypothetical protein